MCGMFCLQQLISDEDRMFTVLFISSSVQELIHTSELTSGGFCDR